MLIKVTPIYGYGWTDGERTVETPGAFEVRGTQSDKKSLVGSVEASNHEFDGARFSATARHTTRDGIYNCRVSKTAGQSSQGYCLIDWQSCPERRRRVISTMSPFDPLRTLRHGSIRAHGRQVLCRLRR